MNRIYLIAVFAMLSMDCYAQSDNHVKDPLKYALIDGTNQSRPVMQRSYLQYVSRIVLTYKIIFHLTIAQESDLQTGLVNYYPAWLYSTKGKADEIHQYIGEKMKALLPYSKYLQWKALKSYPEYSFSVG